MDFSSSRQWINALWILFGLYWFISALKRKKTKQRETWSQRFRYVLPLVAASYLLVRPEAHYGWLGARVVPASHAVEWIGVLLTAAGVAVALWARWHLGANWSGVVTLKEGHELIRTGPYRTIRHPIYTGILLALLGTAVAKLIVSLHISSQLKRPYMVIGSLKATNRIWSQVRCCVSFLVR